MTFANTIRTAAIAAGFALSSAAALAETSPATTPASAGAAAANVPAPTPGMSQVVFFRPSAMGMAVSCNIRENGKMVGTTNNGRYFVLTTTPGLHKFTTKSEKTDEINIQTEADETSYVKCKIGMGIMVGRPNLSPSTKEEFDTRFAKLKPSDAEKMAKTIAEDDAKLGLTPAAAPAPAVIPAAAPAEPAAPAAEPAPATETPAAPTPTA